MSVSSSTLSRRSVTCATGRANVSPCAASAPPACGLYPALSLSALMSSRNIFTRSSKDKACGQSFSKPVICVGAPPSICDCKADAATAGSSSMEFGASHNSFGAKARRASRVVSA